jgi:hypothetical protein
MSWLQGLLDFWNANFGTIIASLIVGLVFFVLGPIGVWFSGRRIKEERFRNAKEEMADLVESMLVSQESIDLKRLRGILHATEPAVDVDVESSYDIEQLLEDVSLRFEKSKHLDAKQKDVYAEKIATCIETAKARSTDVAEESVPRAYNKILADLQLALNSKDWKRASQFTKELKRRLVDTEEEPPNIFSIMLRTYSNAFHRNPRRFFLAVGLTALVYLVIIVTILLTMPR